MRFGNEVSGVHDSSWHDETLFELPHALNLEPRFQMSSEHGTQDVSIDNLGFSGPKGLREGYAFAWDLDSRCHESMEQKMIVLTI